MGIQEEESGAYFQVSPEESLLPWQLTAVVTDLDGDGSSRCLGSGVEDVVFAGPLLAGQEQQTTKLTT